MDVTAIIIARDEAPIIGRAIASIQAGVSEVLVYDTGSVDATREIAAKAGARVVTDGPWERWHFAKARNRAAELATHPWLFTLDADEVVRAGATVIPGAAQDAAAAKVNCVGVCWRMSQDVGAAGAAVRRGVYRDITPRLYDSRRWAYRYKVHNALLPISGKKEHTQAARDIEVEHIPDPDKRAGRSAQTVALLEEATREEPDHYEVHRYLADIYLEAGAYDKAAAAARRYTRSARGQATAVYLSEGWCLLARALDGLGERAEARAAFETAASVAPMRREPLWEAAQLVGRAGDWGAATAYMRRLVAIPARARPVYSPFTWDTLWGPFATGALKRFEQAAATTAGKGN